MSSIRRAREEADIVDIVARYTDLRQAGTATWRAPCPLHGGTRPDSLVVYQAQQTFRCFACGRGGDVVDFVASAEGLSLGEAAGRVGGGPSRSAAHRQDGRSERQRRLERRAAQYPEDWPDALPTNAGLGWDEERGGITIPVGPRQHPHGWLLAGRVEGEFSWHPESGRGVPALTYGAVGRDAAREAVLVPDPLSPFHAQEGRRRIIGRWNEGDDGRALSVAEAEGLSRAGVRRLLFTVPGCSQAGDRERRATVHASELRLLECGIEPVVLMPRRPGVEADLAACVRSGDVSLRRWRRVAPFELRVRMVERRRHERGGERFLGRLWPSIDAALGGGRPELALAYALWGSRACRFTSAEAFVRAVRIWQARGARDDLARRHASA